MEALTSRVSLALAVIPTAMIELSPAAPLGVCSPVASTSQNRVLSALRMTEVVCAARRRGQRGLTQFRPIVSLPSCVPPGVAQTPVSVSPLT